MGLVVLGGQLGDFKWNNELFLRQEDVPAMNGGTWK